MYRLPNQFKSAASQVNSAAGGGSTTTTCSCCVVTAAGASILTAIHFSGLRKAVTATAPISASDDLAPPDSGGDAGRMLSGLFSILIATVVGAMFAAVGGFALGVIMATGTFVGIFALAYESAGLSSGKGIVGAIGAVLAIAICTAIEISLWLGN